MNLTKCDAVDMWQKIFAQIQLNQTKMNYKETLKHKSNFKVERLK